MLKLLIIFDNFIALNSNDREAVIIMRTLDRMKRQIAVDKMEEINDDKLKSTEDEPNLVEPHTSYDTLLDLIRQNDLTKLQETLNKSDPHLINEISTYDGKTLLLHACERKNIECVKLLLTNGAKTDSLCNNILAIDVAFEFQNNELIKLLHPNYSDIALACWILSFSQACCKKDHQAVTESINELTTLHFPTTSAEYDLLSIQTFITHIYKRDSVEGIITFFLRENNPTTNILIERYTNDNMSKEVKWLIACVHIVKRMNASDRPCSWLGILGHFCGQEAIDNLTLMFQIVPDSIIGRHMSGALCIACSNGAVDVVNLLLAHNVDPNIAAPYSRFLPLHEACYCESVQDRCAIVRALLEHGAAVDSVSEEGETALMTTVAHGDEPTSRVLLIHGASLNRIYDTADTLLIDATKYSLAVQERFGYREALGAVIHLLLEYGADTNRSNYLTHDTPLKLACRACNVDLVRLLLERGADPLYCPTSEGLSVMEMMREGWAQYDAVRAICEEYIDTKPLMK